MRKQRPTLLITRSNRYQVRAQVDKVKSHLIRSARDNVAERDDVHHFESSAESLEFIDSLLADNKYLFHVPELVQGGVCGPNPTQTESKAANEWPASTLLPGGSKPGVYLHQILSSRDNRGTYADGFYNSVIDDKDGHIPSPLIMFSCSALRHALVEWQKNKGLHPKASKSKLNAERPDRSNYFTYKTDGGRKASCHAALGRKLFTLPGDADRYTFFMNTWNTLP